MTSNDTPASDAVPVREGDAERALREAIDFLADPWREDAKWPSHKEVAALRQLLSSTDAASAAREERDLGAALALLRNPTSDMLNRAADDIQRNIDPLQQRARVLLDAVADEVERALAAPPKKDQSVTSHPLDEDRQRAASRNPDRQRNQGYTT